MPISKPPDSVTAYFDTAVCGDREIVGRSHRIGPRRVRNPLDAPHRGSLIYRRTKNRRAVQLLLGHTKLESTVRYLGIEVDDA